MSPPWRVSPGAPALPQWRHWALWVGWMEVMERSKEKVRGREKIRQCKRSIIAPPRLNTWPYLLTSRITEWLLSFVGYTKLTAPTFAFLAFLSSSDLLKFYFYLFKPTNDAVQFGHMATQNKCAFKRHIVHILQTWSLYPTTRLDKGMMILGKWSNMCHCHVRSVMWRYHTLKCLAVGAACMRV